MKNLSPTKEIEQGWPERVGNPGILRKGHRKSFERQEVSNYVIGGGERCALGILHHEGGGERCAFGILHHEGHL